MKQAGPRAALCALLLASTWLAEGCAVASATAGAAISVTGAVVSTGVSLTGKAIGAGIDAMSSKPTPTSSTSMRGSHRSSAWRTSCAICPAIADDGVLKT